MTTPDPRWDARAREIVRGVLDRYVGERAGEERMTVVDADDAAPEITAALIGCAVVYGVGRH